MVPRSKRRAIICLAASGIVAVTSGCATVFPDRTGPETDEREIKIENDTAETQTATVRVTVESGEAVFEHRYRIETGHLDESKSIGTQDELDKVTVTAPGLGKISREYPPSQSDDADIVVKLTDDKPKLRFG